MAQIGANPALATEVIGNATMFLESGTRALDMGVERFFEPTDTPDRRRERLVPAPN